MVWSIIKEYNPLVSGQSISRNLRVDVLKSVTLILTNEEIEEEPVKEIMVPWKGTALISTEMKSKILLYPQLKSKGLI